MDKALRIKQVRDALTEVIGLVVFGLVTAADAKPVTEALKAKLAMLEAQYEAELAAAQE